jgi:hypothetical protein
MPAEPASLADLDQLACLFKQVSGCDRHGPGFEARQRYRRAHRGREDQSLMHESAPFMFG